MDHIKHICGRLQDRAATLFLGAGINFGLRNAGDVPFPLGSELSALICENLLGDASLKLTLDEASEMARFKLGATPLNRYLKDLFTSYSPGLAHLSLVQLPWDVIYTTNYDLLVESAATDRAIVAAGKIVPVMSTDTELVAFSDEDILYYKLHGSIEAANTEQGRLILTKEDYRYYETHRKGLFRRLRKDLASRTFLFVGYSLRDDNFRAVLEDCRHELGTQTLPLSFAVRPDFGTAEEAFWREKYNIQLVNCGGSDFLASLRDAWQAQNYSVVPLDVRRTKLYANFDSHTRFERVAESFFRIRPEDCTGLSIPKRFFSGQEPSWSDIRDEIPPPRTAYDAVFEAVFPGIADPSVHNSAFLVTGAAGTGKTTLIRTLAFGLAKLGVPVLVHIPETLFEARHLGTMIDRENLQRLVVIVNHAADSIHVLNRFLEDSQQLGIPLTLILEERKNQWEATNAAERSRLRPAEFILGALDSSEINNILDALQKHNALDKLTGVSRELQVNHFTALAEKELLVALRELTNDNSFDDIVTDEFRKIPSEKARLAYVYVAMLGVVNLGIRYETLLNLLDVRADQLVREIFAPTEGVLITAEEAGNSRHTAGFTIRSRHPIISSVIFSTAAQDDETKSSYLNNLLAQLDPGYAQDRRVLEALVRTRELGRMFASAEKRRGIYERLALILPDDAFVSQHRSILERELGNAELAVKFAREAVKRNPLNQPFLNTLGLALELESRTADRLRSQVLLFEAGKIFDENVRYEPASPFGYVGKVNILRGKFDNERTKEGKAAVLTEAVAMLEEASELTGDSPMITGELAWFRRKLGDLGDVVALVKEGVRKNPADVRLRRMLVQFERDAGNVREAAATGIAGIQYAPTSWLLYRDVARLKLRLNEQTHVVKGFYESAIRHNKGDIALMIELGSFLFVRGNYIEYQKVFRDVDLLQIPGHEKTRIRERLRAGSSLKSFAGKVKVLRGANGYVTADSESVDIFFWRSDARSTLLREGQRVSFHLGFNSKGAIAFDIEAIQS